MRKKGNSFGDWFLMIVIITTLILILVNLSKGGKKKPTNFQSWTLNLIWDDYIVKPLRKL